MSRRFESGDAIVERGIFGGGVVFARPSVVVAHTDEVLASYVPIGTRYHGIQPSSRETVMDEFRRGELRWGENTWHSHDVLILVRPDDPYSICGFWNEERTFVAWYVNLQDPMRLTPIGYDTRDHLLDIIVGEDLASWLWKDEDELEASVDLGLFDAEERDAIRRNGEAVVSMIEDGGAWWGDWRSFAPDPAWPVPELTTGWDRV